MGNVSFSCCKSKSPRLQQLSKKFGCGSASNNLQSDSKHSYSGDKKHSFEQNNLDASSVPQSILQHISERELDYSETDPSSNPTNQPIFAARSCPNPRTKRNSDQQQASPVSQPSPNLSNEQYLKAISGSHIACSQDDGYSTSTPTYNLTNPLYGGRQEDSFKKQQELCKVGYLTEQQKRQSMENGNDTLQLDCRDQSSASGNHLLRTNHHPYNERRFSEYVHPRAELKPKIAKAASTSTIFIDSSTISQPCLDLTIKCVSLAIYYHIKNRSSDNGTDIFDENKHPLKLPENEELLKNYKDCEQFDDSDDETNDLSTKKAVYTYVKTLFTSAELTSEHAITTLVYLERLMTYTELDLAPTTWRRMFLGAILLSSKVWEDQAVWNVDYADILEGISVEDINELERRFLEFIQFNMNVPSSVYAKYYFHLRSLAFENNLTEARGLLTVGRAKTMEAMSRVVGTDPNASPVQRNTKPQEDIKRHASLERLRLNGNTRAVLM